MNILIADNQHLVLEGLANILSEIKSANVYQASHKGLVTYRLRNQNIDILFQDLLFGDHNAREFIQDLIREFPDLKIIAISSVSDLEIVESLFKQGVHGYLLKSDDLS